MSGISDLLKKYIEDTTRLIVDNPEEVEIFASISTKTVIVQIKVEKTDCGKIIGKHGRTIESLKVLCLAVKNTQFPNDSRRVVLEVLEDEDSDFTYK